ncbi:hypothetical protein [Bradyrhizobium valentinum]|uniref:Uncharacterized protein n=1 Tax=Bradyrhizobium valentinum TaxID=1518501 RepID=A0A0R3LNB0_9BRAD|nr:hypothetical protein [Bradyrhizobium valentinum]KRR09290.1 hypothetical protein CP49_20900 [Bradyrhizobium valentinum]
MHRDDARMMKFCSGAFQSTGERKPKGYSNSSANIIRRSRFGIFTMLGIDPMHLRSKLGDRLFRLRIPTIATTRYDGL